MNYSLILNQLIDRRDLAHADMLDLMQHIMGGQLTPAQIAAVLVALRAKGESISEIAAAAEVMRELSTKVVVQDNGHLIDTCGTGGDRQPVRRWRNTVGAPSPANAAAPTYWRVWE